MNKNEKISYWLKSAEHDLLTADSLFAAGRYDWCLFIGCLVIEKVLKAHFVSSNENIYPPKTYDLVYLAKKLDLNFSSDKMMLLETISSFNIEARYPDEKFSFYKLCTKEFTEYHYNKIKEIYEWLLSQTKLEQS